MTRRYTYDQHFLRSPRFVAELVSDAKLRADDTVYDLGAGSGVITAALARRCKRVVAVENEPDALGRLRTNTGTMGNVVIVAQDIMHLRLPSEPYKVFANIPFSLSAQIVRMLTESDRSPKVMYLIVQKQFARKLVPSDQHFTAQLGVQLAPRFTARIRRSLQKTDFTPPPAVDTVMLELQRRPEPLLPAATLPAYREFVARCFDRQKFFATLPRNSAHISPEKRPSQLTIDEWLRLFAASCATPDRPPRQRNGRRPKNSRPIHL